jgi:threonine/homoserine/homoserine lactone efflux protein
VALGAVFVVNGTLVNLAFARIVARLRGRLAGPRGPGRWIARGAGALFVALGVRLALFSDGTT